MSLSPSKRKLDDDNEEDRGKGGMDGLQFELDGESSTVVGISSRFTMDVQRWRETMPSLVMYPHLTQLDLYKNRYITSLDPSVTTLTQLKILKLVQCAKLRELPANIGSLTRLEVVRCLARTFC